MFGLERTYRSIMVGVRKTASSGGLIWWAGTVLLGSTVLEVSLRSVHLTGARGLRSV